MGSKGKPYRTVFIEGFEVLIGRAAADNDTLTFEVAEPNDVWMHVAGGTPGSHVVVRCPDGLEIPRSALEGAAAAAAWYSKSRNAARVDVHVCRARDVSKPRAAKAGLVTLSRWKSLRVSPARPAAENGDDGPND